MRNLFFVLTILLFGFSAHAQNTDKLLNDYISVKDALIISDPKAASSASHILYQSIKNEGNFSGKTELLKAVEKLNKVSGLEKQRAALDDVSTLLWKLVKGADKTNKSVYYQYCPMKKAYWLSYDKEIKNPYYGASMLSCGKIIETIK